MVQGIHHGVHLEKSFTPSLKQESNHGLEECPFSASSQFTTDVAKGASSEINLNTNMDAQEPYLASNQSSGEQMVHASLQTLPQSSVVAHVQRVGRNHSSPEGNADQPKSLQHSKPSVLSSRVPPPVSESSPSRTPTCKIPPMVTACDPTKLQPTSNQISHANSKVSKLRPPSGSFRQRQLSSPRAEPQNFQVKTSIPRPLIRRKEIVQNPNGSLNSGDCLASGRYSRLPKPKIH